MDMGLLLIISFLVFTFIGVPIGISLGVATLLGYLLTGTPLASLGQVYYTGLDSYSFIAIPLFILAGSLMSKGGLSRRLTNVADALVGSVQGGLGMASILASAFFAAISGSGPATTAAVGGVMVPEMRKRNYKKEFAAAVVASGGVLGILIPPSISLLLYGVIGGFSVAKLFMAGFVPGIITALLLMLTTYLLSRNKGYMSSERFSLARFGSALKGAIWALMAPVIVLGGIYGGFFTPTEASAVAVIYGLVAGVLIYKELKWSDIVRCFTDAARTTGLLALVWAAAAAYGNILTLFNIPQRLTASLLVISHSPIVILLLIEAFLFILGMFLNGSSMVIILTPIFVPLIKQLGINPYVFGVLFTVACEIGFLTPPVGTNLFVAMGIAETSLEEISMAVLPFIATLCVTVLLLIFFPGIITLLPNLIH